jgi:hypothetical protein
MYYSQHPMSLKTKHSSFTSSGKQILLILKSWDGDGITLARSWTITVGILFIGSFAKP